MNLYDYLFTNVRIIDTEDIEHIGYVDLYENEYDSGDDEPVIGLSTGIALLQSEIKSIEKLDTL